MTDEAGETLSLGLDGPELRRFYVDHLFGQMLPYWLEHGVDDEYGAYLTGFSNDGKRLLHCYKLPWSQGRFVWLWARLAAQFPAHPLAERFLELSRSGADFLRANCLMPNGEVAFTLDRDGIPILLDADGKPRAARPGESYGSSTYTDLYVVYGLSEYARQAGDLASLEFAWDLYWSAVRRYREGRFRTDPYPTPSGYKAHGVPMFLLDTGRELAVTAERLEWGDTRELRQLVTELVGEVMDHHRQPDDVVIELLGTDNQVRPTKLGTYVNPGLMFQDMWFIMHYAEEAGDQARIQQAARVVRRACELGWDDEYGGFFQFVHRTGGPPRGEVPPEEAGHPMLANLDSNWDGKFYWVHSEALYALLLSYFHTQEPWALQWYRRVHDYTFRTFPSGQPGGEWINLRNRDGTPSDKPAAVPVKDPFHANRDLVLAIALLERWA